MRSQLDMARAAQASTPSSIDLEGEIRTALDLYDNLERVAHNPEARSSIPALMKKIDLRPWLNFGEGQKGRRKIRLLKGGVITTVRMSPPVQPYGSSATDHNKVLNDNCAEPGMTGSAKSSPVKRVGVGEEDSYTKGNRGDWTPIELFIDQVGDWKPETSELIGRKTVKYE